MNSYTVDKSDGPCDRMLDEDRKQEKGTGFFRNG
jgi:hypothetical protein